MQKGKISLVEVYKNDKKIINRYLEEQHNAHDRGDKEEEARLFGYQCGMDFVLTQLFTYILENNIEY